MWWQHDLPEEDGVFDDRSISTGAVTHTVAVIAYPRISNLDELQLLKNIPSVRLQWVCSPSELAALSATDWIIFLGSKHTNGDLAWLRSRGWTRPLTITPRRVGRCWGCAGDYRCWARR
jgi:adenosylcobyric acid synthase